MLELNFHPFPILETQRLLLKQITSIDTRDLFALRSNMKVMKFVKRPIAKSIDEINELLQKINTNWQNNNGNQWGITIKNSPQLIGVIGYHRIEKEHYRAEIGYMLNDDYWNKGITNEAIQAVIHYGFMQMKLHSIEAHIDPDNFISSKVLLKQGFIKEAYLKENFFFNGEFLDTEIYSLLKSNYQLK